MLVVIAGKDPANLEEYLAYSGHKVKCFYVNDICLDIARTFLPDVFIYMEDVVDKIPHEQALKQLQDYRVLIVAAKENPIIPYAAALGIKDFVFQPCELSAILNLIDNPATSEQAAEMLAGRSLPQQKPMSREGVKLKKKGKGILRGGVKLDSYLNDKPGTKPIQKHTGILIIKPDEFIPEKINKGVIVDTDGRYSREIEKECPDLWKSDWRLGASDAKAHCFRKTALYSQTEMLGPLDERDQSRFIEFIETLQKKHKQIYVIDSGRWLEELLRWGALEGGV